MREGGGGRWRKQCRMSARGEDGLVNRNRKEKMQKRRIKMWLRGDKEWILERVQKFVIIKREREQMNQHCHSWIMQRGSSQTHTGGVFWGVLACWDTERNTYRFSEKSCGLWEWLKRERTSVANAYFTWCCIAACLTTPWITAFLWVCIARTL